MNSLKTLTLSAIVAASMIVPAVAKAESVAEHGMAESPMMKMGAAFEEADTNKDGSLDLKEFLARHEVKFKEIDANSDGKLTQEEFQAHRESMKKKMGEHRKEIMEDRHEKMEGSHDADTSKEQEPADTEDEKSD